MSAIGRDKGANETASNTAGLDTSTESPYLFVPAGDEDSAERDFLALIAMPVLLEEVLRRLVKGAKRFHDICAAPIRDF